MQLNNNETLVCRDIQVHDDCTMNSPPRTFNVTLMSLNESVAECAATAVVTVNDDPYSAYYLVVCVGAMVNKYSPNHSPSFF